VPDDVLQQRRQRWEKDAQLMNRGYVSLYVNHVLQADKGADFDFLVGGSGSEVSRDSH
jgi:dihydroxy-acid dehydratase